MPDSTGKHVVVEAFARHGVKITEDDPMVVVGTVLELAMDRAGSSAAGVIKQQVDGALSAGLAEYVRKLETAGSSLTRTLEAAGDSIKANAEAASYRAEQAVKRAASITPDTKWKFYALGVATGAALVILGEIVQAFLRH